MNRPDDFDGFIRGLETATLRTATTARSRRSQPARLIFPEIDVGSLPPFEHDPLDLRPSQCCIRLLKFTPHVHRWGTVAECQMLNNVRVSESTLPYIAGSYEWGSQQGLRAIAVDGRSMSMQQNLYDFLWSLISKKYNDGEFIQPLYLWIDAMCIDQGQSSERNHQVSQMRLIYENAHEVIAWLGRSELESEEAFTQAQDLLTASSSSVNRASAADIYQLSRRERGSRVRDSYRQRFDSHVSNSLLELAKRSYWRRVWIIQELLVSQDCKILCGSVMLSWNTWAIAVQTASFEDVDFFKRGSFRDTPALFIIDQWFTRQTDPNAMSVFDLVYKFRDSEASDIRDKVYALLGIAANGDQIKVNYDASVSHTLLEVLISSGWSFNDEKLTSLCDVLNVNMASLYAAIEPNNRLRFLLNKTGKDVDLLPEQHIRLLEFLRTVGTWQTRTIRDTCQKKLVEWSDLNRIKFCDCSLCSKQWRARRASTRRGSLIPKILTRYVTRPAGRRGGGTVRMRLPLVVICFYNGSRQKYFASGIFLPYLVGSRDSGYGSAKDVNPQAEEVENFLLLYHDPRMQELDAQDPGAAFSPWPHTATPDPESTSSTDPMIDEMLTLDHADGENDPADLVWPGAYSITQSLLFYAHAMDYTRPPIGLMNVRSSLGPQSPTIGGLPEAELSIGPTTAFQFSPRVDSLPEYNHAKTLVRSRRHALMGLTAWNVNLIRDYEKVLQEVETVKLWFSSLVESQRTFVFHALLQQNNTGVNVKGSLIEYNLDPHFHGMRGSMTDWFSNLAPGGRTAVLRAFAEQVGDVQQRLFTRAMGYDARVV